MKKKWHLIRGAIFCISENHSLYEWFNEAYGDE